MSFLHILLLPCHALLNQVIRATERSSSSNISPLTLCISFNSMLQKIKFLNCQVCRGSVKTERFNKGSLVVSYCKHRLIEKERQQSKHPVPRMNNTCHSWSQKCPIPEFKIASLEWLTHKFQPPLWYLNILLVYLVECGWEAKVNNLMHTFSSLND